MPLTTLADVLGPALAQNHAVAGLVVLGWEEARAYVAAGEAEGVPVILQAGPGCRAHTPLPVLGAMFRSLAETASIPVVAHLDHGYDKDVCEAAILAGFTSVMFDGSRLPLDQNIAQTREIVELAHSAGVSCEGEIGFVGYDGGEASAGTVPEEAARFAAETGVDAMAISVGNVHLQQTSTAELDESRIHAIGGLTNVPLVIHGGSGVPAAQRQHLARTTAVCKFNIGTELRMAFGSALRDSISAQPGEFDRVKLLSATEESVKRATQRVLQSLN